MSVLDYIRGLVLRGRVSSTDATSGIQGVYVETLADDGDDAEHFQPYGLSAAVPAGSECIVVKVGGADDHLVAVVCDDRASRPTDLEDGEVALYSKHGQQIRLLADGSIAVIPKAGADVVLGEQLASQAAALEAAVASKVETEIKKITALLCTWTVLANDGGLALQTAAKIIWGAAGTNVGDTSSPNVKVKI